MSHNCVKRINQELMGDPRSANTQIAIAVSFSEPTKELIEIRTCKRDVSVRGRPLTFFASFCPFCGVKLNQS